MGFGMEAGIFLVYTACLMAIYFFGKLLLKPLKFILKLMINSVIGGAALLMINGIGGSLGIFIPLNIITAVTAGLTGVPGIAVLLVYFRFFV